jgi:hypothetical protein
MKIATRCVCCDGTRLTRTPAVLAPFVAARVFGWEPVEITAQWGLRDVLPGNAYTLCNSLECAVCGALFLDMRFDDDEMAALYRGYRDAAYTASRDRFEPGYAARNAHYLAGSPYVATVERFLEKHMPANPRILDHGGDTGANTPFRGRMSLHHVHDISGMPTVEGAVSVDLPRARDTSYDLIVTSQVLEHVPHPADMLREIAALMRDHTMVYVEVPHETLFRDSTPGAPNGPRKRLWHEHVNFFTTNALDAMLARAGLTAIDRQSTPVMAGGRQAHIFCVLARRAKGAPK